MSTRNHHLRYTIKYHITLYIVCIQLRASGIYFIAIKNMCNIIIIRNIINLRKNIAAKLSQHGQPCLSCFFVVSSKFIVSSIGSKQY